MKNIKKQWFISLGVTMLISLAIPVKSYGMDDKEKEEFFSSLKKVLPVDVQLKIQQTMLQEAIIFLGMQPIILERYASEEVTSVAISNNIVAIGLSNGIARIWDIKSDQLLYQLKDHGIINAVAISHDFIITGSSGSTKIKVWDIKNGQLVYQIKGHIEKVTSIATSDDFFVTGSGDNTAKIWNIKNGQLQHTLKGHTEGLFSPEGITSVATNGNIVITGAADATAKIWDVKKGNLLRTLEGHQAGVSSVAISGDTIATGSHDSTVKIWNIQSNQPLYTLEGEAESVMSVAINNKVVIAGLSDGTTRIWDIKSGQLLRTLGQQVRIFEPQGIVEQELVNSVAISDDIVVTGLSSMTMGGRDNVITNGIAKIWPLSPNLQGTTNDNTLKWIIYNANMPQANLIKRAYEATAAEQEFILDSKDLKMFLELPMQVRRYLLNRLNINIKK